jgi:hypothetical protein
VTDADAHALPRDVQHALAREERGEGPTAWTWRDEAQHVPAPVAARDGGRMAKRWRALAGVRKAYQREHAQRVATLARCER